MAVEPSSRQSRILLLANAIANRITSLISVHNADSSAHSTILTNYIQKSSTSGLVKNDGSIDSNEYVTNQELHENIPINYVVTSTDNTLTEDVSTFIVGEDYYFVIRAFKGSSEIYVNDIRCEIDHSGVIDNLISVESDDWSKVFKFTPMEQKGHVLRVYRSDTLVATYTFDAIIDTGWQNVSFLNGYTNYSGDNLKIRRIGNIVEINGSWTALKNKTASTAPIHFATIDEEFRPVSTVYVRQQGPGMNTYLLGVEPNGNVYWSKYGTNSSSNLTASNKYICHALWTVNGGAVGGGSNGTGGSNVDLSNYYTKGELDVLIPNELSDLINDTGFITSSALPSKTSDLINDSSFTTLQAVYPVGSIYMSVNTVSPSILFGFGVWEKIEDKFLLASGTTFEDGSTGGSADSVVVSHNHTQNSHTHNARAARRFVVVGDGANWSYSGNIKIRTDGSGTAYYYPHSDKDTGGIIEHTETGEASPTINSTGEDGTGKNMPPYIAVNMWQRIE